MNTNFNTIKEFIDYGFNQASKGEYEATPLGNFRKLPTEITQMIFNCLPPFEVCKIKTVSSEVNKLLPECKDQPEYAIALKNLEIIRPMILVKSKMETGNNLYSSTMNLDAKGNLEVYTGDNIGIFIRKGDGLVAQEKEGIYTYLGRIVCKSQGEQLPKIKLNFFTIYWEGANKPIEKINKFALGISTTGKSFSRVENETVEKVRQHTIFLAKQLWDGANAIATKDGKKLTRSPTGFPFKTAYRADWESTILDANRSLDTILEAGKGVKHINRSK